MDFIFHAFRHIEGGNAVFIRFSDIADVLAAELHGHILYRTVFIGDADLEGSGGQGSGSGRLLLGLGFICQKLVQGLFILRHLGTDDGEAGDLSLAVHKNGGGEAARADGIHQVVAFGPFYARIGDAVLLQHFLSGADQFVRPGLVLLILHADDTASFFLHALVDPVHFGHFIQAVAAPGAPEVDHCILVGGKQVGGGNGVSVQVCCFEGQGGPEKRVHGILRLGEGSCFQLPGKGLRDLADIRFQVGTGGGGEGIGIHAAHIIVGGKEIIRRELPEVEGIASALSDLCEFNVIPYSENGFQFFGRSPRDEHMGKGAGSQGRGVLDGLRQGIRRVFLIHIGTGKRKGHHGECRDIGVAGDDGGFRAAGVVDGLIDGCQGGNGHSHIREVNRRAFPQGGRDHCRAQEKGKEKTQCFFHTANLPVFICRTSGPG